MPILLPLAVAVPLFLQAAPTPMLDPPTRAVLLMALLAFVLLGLGLVAGAMLGGRWVRRIGGDELTKPLQLRRSAADRQEPTPAMLRGVHYRVDSDTKVADAAGSETATR
ncbi:hypothetical protein Pla108_30310 [Botrimarina colliarenosi]|uniref:Uncharacterized protein n=1 Tax=Botrimarina colliarenosi TaxID=2528001 RepID=A0A5C6A7P9_9BACT|nr:hypothetical protein [Botrimarina colliarenosi]TWT95954.1 hypothetical protein Pla108_30310 [Botrimarina colliarenosi]